MRNLIYLNLTGLKLTNPQPKNVTQINDEFYFELNERELDRFCKKWKIQIKDGEMSIYDVYIGKCLVVD